MKTYIHKEKGFWKLEDALPLSYNTGTIADYDNGAYVLLSSEQSAFHEMFPEASQMEVWSMELVPIPEPDPVPEPNPLKEAIQKKIWVIIDYDKSDAVNSFSVNNVLTWLTPDIRANYRNSIEAAELLGETYITFIIANIAATTTFQDARIMLAKIQRYADRCTIVTETHKATVSALATVEEIDAYDNTVGYPDKESFTIIQNLNLSEGGATA